MEGLELEHPPRCIPTMATMEGGKEDRLFSNSSSNISSEHNIKTVTVMNILVTMEPLLGSDGLLPCFITRLVIPPSFVTGKSIAEKQDN